MRLTACGFSTVYSKAQVALPGGRLQRAIITTCNLDQCSEPMNMTRWRVYYCVKVLMSDIWQNDLGFYFKMLGLSLCIVYVGQIAIMPIIYRSQAFRFFKKCPGLPILRVGEDIVDWAIGLHYIFGSQVSTVPRTMPLYIEKRININVVASDQ